MKYSTQDIRRRYNAGEAMTFLLFWGHTSKPGKIKKACLSQWYPCDFAVDGVRYHTTEQYMMAQKALLFEDSETHERIMQADHPADYKALGRAIRHFDEEKWNARKDQIVLAGNIAKFSQNPELKDFLLGTGDSVLAEASPYDCIWGIGLGMDDPLAGNPNHWRGENLLGFVLMETRDILASSGHCQV